MKIYKKEGEKQEITEDGFVLRKYLKPGDVPEAIFKCDAEKVTAREYCNIHGLWIK